jgi:protein-tyrosine phosphatase
MVFHFDMLEPGLALSGAPGGDEGVLPFDVILNVCDPEPPAYATRLPASVRLIRHAFEDNLPAPLPFIRAAVLELADCRRQELKTLIHCQAGQSRSPSVVALYWMARDSMSWDSAIHRARVARPQCQPHPLLVGQQTRNSVVESARCFLTGDTSILEKARADTAALWLAHRERGTDEFARIWDWDVIEPGLACGSCPRAADELVRGGFTGFLNLDSLSSIPYLKAQPPDLQVATVTMRDDEAVLVSSLREAADIVRRWRAEGRGVFVHCSDGKSRSPLILAVYVMMDRGWDFASAMWYIRQRRKGAWPRPQLCPEQAISQLGL